MASPKNWQELALKKLGYRNTMPEGIAPNKAFSLESLPNFQIYEFTPNRKLDQIPEQSLNNGKRYLIAGKEWSIIQQTSLIKALHDILGERLGYNFTFEEWFKAWEEGFAFGINRSGSVEGLVTNFPLITVGGKQGWREDLSRRPAYLEWRNPNPKFRPGYRVIEYFPDKSVKDISYVFVGSDTQIIQKIIEVEHKTLNGESEGDAFRISNDSYRRVGHPEIFIKFYQRSNIEPGKQPLKSVFQVCMNEHVEKQSLKVLPQEKILDIAELKN